MGIQWIQKLMRDDHILCKDHYVSLAELDVDDDIQKIT